jgi:hypothetical protein
VDGYVAARAELGAYSFGVASPAPGLVRVPARGRVRAACGSPGPAMAGRGRLRISSGGMSRIPYSLSVPLSWVFESIRSSGPVGGLITTVSESLGPRVVSPARVSSGPWRWQVRVG